MTRTRLIILGIASALIACTALTTYWLNRPTTVTFAVGPAGSEAARLVDALRLALQRERSSVRLKLAPSDSPSDSAARIDREEADFAIVRADIAFPPSALTVAVWQRNPVVLAAPSSSGIERWTDLPGRSVGVVGRGTGANIRLVETILREHGIQIASVRLVDIQPWEAGEAFKKQRIQALVTVGPAAAKPVADAMAGLFREAPGGQVTLVPIREAEAMAERVFFLESIDVVAGSFGSNPPRPPESYPTLGVVHYLVARRGLPDAIVAEFTQQLFTLRPALATQHPVAYRIEVPETDKGSSVQVHPGALGYLTGEQKTFLERYSEVLYLAIFVVSLGGSAMAALASYFGFGRREPDPGRLPEVLHLLRGVRATDDPDELDAIAQRADDIFVEAIERSKEPDFDEGRFATLTLALDRLNAALADRRRALAMQADYGEEQDPGPAESRSFASRG
ncbi:TAXI family TRAP transporter solute-binding subunit [Phreatobacter sp. AB_2022a]|uniref:TAXI family TRAP transporter solute-binding subunit n=1 Tax=Phreatobacter sp. AB_2022a TaxID=3003134 RepID=UPI0022872A93|nr:TAXI family TRAP transporter solute-binding subunit [Phreatobacter sp. AB_2022a]MCZ0737424.1 ABC transporter substrate-binding protein [Phreatobacter sp. AB_2022a]